MRCSLATRLSSLSGENDDFMVLPGMEVNFRLSPPLGFARIHLLVILPEGATSERFSRLFQGQAGIPDDAQRNGQEEVTGIALDEWIRRVHEEGGICLAAHVENLQGIRCQFRQTAQETLKLFTDGDGVELERENEVPENLREYLLSSGLNGIEVHRSKDVCHYRWISQVDGKPRWIATALTFDAHTVEEFGRVDRVTHVKMTRLGLKDLRAALTFPDTRIRFPDNLPSPPSPRLLGIEISGTDKSFFQHVSIALTENLNCLIGVRGSGKSTVVEALRYVFGYNRTLDELDKLKIPIRDMQKANLTGCILRVAYRTRAGEDRILSATYDEKADYVTRVTAVNGDPLQVSDVETSGDYPLRLFGWSEIETLGRSPSKQRDLLDRLIPDLASVLQRRRDLRNDLRANRGSVTKAIAAVKAAYEKDDGFVRRFKEFQADFDKLNTAEVKGLFATFDLLYEKKRLLTQLRLNADTLVERLTATTPATLRTELDALLAKSSPELRNWWLEQELARLDVAGAELDIQRSLQQAIERIRAFAAVVIEHTGQISTMERESCDDLSSL
jgi:energy-coupling factor transporter ATP-binding protein EcfA2